MNNYRQSTAKALGLKNWNVIIDDIVIYDSDDGNNFIWWQPDKDGIQMIQVWEWLKGQKGIELDIEFNPEDGWIFTIREYMVSSDKALYISEKNNSLFTATERAFLEYIKQNDHV